MKRKIFLKVLILFLIDIILIYSKSYPSDITLLHSLAVEKARELTNIKPLEYKINLKLEKDNNLNFQVRLNFICKEDNAKKIKFFISEEVELKEIKLDGEKIRFGTATFIFGLVKIVRGILDEPLEKDKIYELTVIYSYKLPQNNKEAIHLKLEDFWFPQVYPDEFFKVYFNITIPKNLICITSGELKEVKEDKDFKSYTYEVQKNYGFLNFICGEFKIKSGKFKHVNIEVYYPKELEKFQRITEDTLLFSKEILDLYEKKFSLLYPSNHLRVVFDDTCSDTYIHGDVIVIGKYYIFVKDYTFYFAIAHEIAHRWFGMECGLLAKSGKGVLFLTEGLVNYLAVFLRNKKYEYLYSKRDEYWQILKLYLESINKAKCLRVSEYYSQGDECAIAAGYYKSPLLLRLLSYLTSEKDFAKILNLYVSENSHKFPTIENFKNAVFEVVGNKLDWFFNVFIESNQKFDIAISDKIGTRVKKEKDYWTTTFNINKNIDDVKIENLQVLLIGKETSYLKNVSLTSTNQTWTFKTKDEIIAVYLDPEFYIFDTDPENNFYSPAKDELNYALENYNSGKYNEALKLFQIALQKDPYIFTLHYPEIRECFLLNKKSKEFEKLLKELSKQDYLLTSIENVKNQIKDEEEKGFIKSWGVYKPDKKEIDFDKEEIPIIKSEDIIKPYEDNIYGTFDFKYIFPGEKDYIVCALVSVYSDYERDVYIKFGSEPKVKLYLNNKNIFSRNVSKKNWYRVYDIIPIKLKDGQNRIVVKFYIEGKNTRFTFGLLDKDYSHLKNIIYSTK